MQLKSTPMDTMVMMARSTAAQEWDSYGPTFQTGDIIGVGLNTESNSIFHEKRGSWLGVAFENVCRDALYPTVGLHSRGEQIQRKLWDQSVHLSHQGTRA